MVLKQVQYVFIIQVKIKLSAGYGLAVMLSILSRTISKTIDKMALYVIAYYRFPRLTLSLRSTRHKYIPNSLLIIDYAYHQHLVRKNLQIRDLHCTWQPFVSVRQRMCLSKRPFVRLALKIFVEFWKLVDRSQ